MSRLYSKVTSDARKNPATCRGHKEILAQVLYGTATHSVEAASMTLQYDDRHDEYSLRVCIRGIERRTYILSKP